MSSATDVILSLNLADDERREGRVTPGMAAFRAWCEDKAIHAEVGNHEIRWPSGPAEAGGYKPIGRAIYAFCVNHLDETAFLDAVEAAPWHYPNLIQVFFRHENDPHFRTFAMNKDREWAIGYSGVEEWWPPRQPPRFVPLASPKPEGPVRFREWT